MNQSLPSRRNFFRTACCSTLGVAGSFSLASAHAADAKKTSLTADQALAKLKKGNADFLLDRPSVAADQRHLRRLEIARSQAPFAVLVGCSDSRVPPEDLFGAGLGELFIVRNAGNTVDTTAMGSIQYGVLVLGAPLIVVLGHERCGAVDAAVHENVRRTVERLRASEPSLIEPLRSGALKVVGARYDLDDGTVDFFMV